MRKEYEKGIMLNQDSNGAGKIAWKRPTITKIAIKETWGSAVNGADGFSTPNSSAS